MVERLAVGRIEHHDPERLAQVDDLAVGEIAAVPRDDLAADDLELRHDRVVARLEQAGEFRDAITLPELRAGFAVDRVDAAAATAVDPVAVNAQGRVGFLQALCSSGKLDAPLHTARGEVDTMHPEVTQVHFVAVDDRIVIAGKVHRRDESPRIVRDVQRNAAALGELGRPLLLPLEVEGPQVNARLLAVSAKAVEHEDHEILLRDGNRAQVLALDLRRLPHRRAGEVIDLKERHLLPAEARGLVADEKRSARDLAGIVG